MNYFLILLVILACCVIYDFTYWFLGEFAQFLFALGIRPSFYSPRMVKDSLQRLFASDS